MNHIFRAFQSKNYRLYWGGFALSLIGTWMQTLAQGWLVWRLTESAFWLGVIAAMPNLPSLIFGSIGGVIIDRTIKRTVLIITQTGLALSAFALAWFTLRGEITLELLVIISVISGVFAAVDAPARLSFVTEIVGKENLSNAIAFNSTSFNAARLIGPAIAGFLIPIVGEGGCFLINGFSYIALIIGLMLMKNLPKPVNNHTLREPIWPSIKEAYQFVKNSPVHNALMVNTIVFGALGFSYTVLMPIYADHILDVGVRGLGMLMGTIGIGALAGGIWQITFPTEKKRGKIVILGAISLGLGLIVFAFSKVLPLSLVMLPFVGFGGIIMLASTNTLLQTYAPDHLRGRVMGFYTTAFLGVAPIGNFLIGILAAKLGAPWAMAIASAICLIVAWRTILNHKELRAV